MLMKEYLKSYIPMAQFLAKVCGPSCEIVLHDVTDVENSLIYIENSKTDRQIGSPLTDLALSVKNNPEYAKEDFITNYNGTSKGKKFLSSTYLIKYQDELVGMLCVNRDISATEDMFKAINFFVEQNNLMFIENHEVEETLEDPVAQLVTTSINAAFDEINIPASQMTIDDKIRIVKKLNTQGILKMRGAMDELAERLDVSKPTIYRYIHAKN